MKKLILLCLSLAFFLPLYVYGQEGKMELKTEKDKLSYALGIVFGDTLKSYLKSGIEIDKEVMKKAFLDMLDEKKPLLEEAETKLLWQQFRTKLQGMQEAKRKESEGKNKQEGEVFLAANKKKEGIVTLPSGLQYKILKAGTGKIPKKSDTVETHYRGTLINGTEFDSSYSRNQTASFPVGGVIPGWTEALQLMKVGAKWQLFIPSNLAYGSRGAGAKIGPDSTLVFDIELIAIK